MVRMGMEVDQVEAVGRSLKERAAAIDGIVGRIDKTESGLLAVWDGPDAKRFVHDWWPEHRKVLVAGSTHVAGLGQSALNNAAEQRQVSGSSTPGTGGDATVPMPPYARPAVEPPIVAGFAG